MALQLSECVPVPDVDTLWFDDERTLLMAFHDILTAYDADILTGYNINNFDIPYLLWFPRMLLSKMTDHRSAAPGYWG